MTTSAEWYSPCSIGLIYAGIGGWREAFALLERAYRERDPQMVFLKTPVTLDPLRSDPRFDDMLHRIGFPEE